MSELATLCLARSEDAEEIAGMSRDAIEEGLTWSWTPTRVRRSILSRESSVVVARREERVAAFAIMYFGDDVAHLNLLAVAAPHRRQGIGRRLIQWLSESAVEAGVFRIDLELRARNAAARAFYERLGFEALNVVQGYYQGLEPALRMTKHLGDS
jgi:[ribosomal protein S18]-alanine N-acetyltransferase